MGLLLALRYFTVFVKIMYSGMLRKPVGLFKRFVYIKEKQEYRNIKGDEKKCQIRSSHSCYLKDLRKGYFKHDTSKNGRRYKSAMMYIVNFHCYNMIPSITLK